MERSPRLDAALVEEFVGSAHADLARVSQLLEHEPRLVNAAWDWGGGDWETGLGAASHMGQREIARYLLAHGARLDLFAAAMLGEMDVVKAVLDTFPEALHIPGPHGIPLVAHAKAGGAQATRVLAYLQSLELAS